MVRAWSVVIDAVQGDKKRMYERNTYSKTLTFKVSCLGDVLRGDTDAFNQLNPIFIYFSKFLVASKFLIIKKNLHTLRGLLQTIKTRYPYKQGGVPIRLRFVITQPSRFPLQFRFDAL